MSISVKANITDYIETGTLFAEKTEGMGRKNNTIFAGASKLANDPIAEKRKEAQEKAMKVIRDAWDIDKSIDKNVEDRKTHYEKMLAQKNEAQSHVNDINDSLDSLKEEYGITEDMKYKDWPEEYKQRYLELNKQKSAFQDEIQDADKLMKDDISDIKAIAIERLKSSPVDDAQETADAIKEAANDEIIGMVMQEAKENIDKEMEETEEKAEKNAEKEEIKEEKLEDIREIKALQEAVIQGTKDAVAEAEAKSRENESPDLPLNELMKLTKVNSETDKAQKTLDDIKYSMNLLDADLKGIEIDEEL